MKLVFLVLNLLMIMSSVSAQNLGNFNPKEDRGALGPRKFSSRDIYIANFSVNFQIYNLKTTSTKGGFANGMLSGNTKASLAVGLDIPALVLQQITNNAYRELVESFKANGFNVLNGDAAANTKYYEGYQRFENLEMSLAEAPGMVTVYPTSAVFYLKGFTKDGQKKQGSLSGTMNRIMNDDGRNTVVDEVSSYGKLSAELNDASIVNVDLYVLFLDVKKPYQGNGAIITANTNLRLAAYEHIKSRITNNSTTAKLGLSPSSKEKNYLCVSAIDFVSGRNKIGGSPLGTYTGVLKSDLNINEVLGNEKVESYAKSDQDFIGTETAFGKVYRADNISVENTALIKADSGKYQEGVQKALSTFLKHHIDEFESKFFK